MESKEKNEVIVLGGGCFWCMEAIFKRVAGIVSVVPGYAGGHKPNPTYQEVCTGTTGHAEVVKVEFNPEIITLDRILEVFFNAHDPTTPNRQGNDIGTQYRSIILYTSEKQLPIIRKALEKAEKQWQKPPVTEVKPLNTFWTAEQYHHNYFDKNPEKPYCQVVIKPKVEKLITKGMLNDNI